MTARADKNRGFTLVELLVASTLAAMAMAALLSGFVFLARNFTRLSNLQALEGQSRTALAYLRRDLSQARAIKSDGAITATELTLLMPAGEVTYSYDGGSGLLRRQAAAGTQPAVDLLTAANCRCTAFAFSYYTGTGGTPASQFAPTGNTAYSIKQLRVSFELQTPSAESAQTRMRHRTVSARLNLRNKEAPDGG